jgi:zinc D-Ala-D-Ala carboxypeptidase
VPFSTRTILPHEWTLIKHFKPSEFKEPEKMGFEMMRWLDLVRERAGVPFRITSSYRSPEYNKEVGGAKDSAHTDVPCDAVDIGKPTNEARYKIIRAAMDCGCQRLGLYQNGSIHLDRSEDSRPAPRIWIAVERPA